jgi:hypothetical protein
VTIQVLLHGRCHNNGIISDTNVAFVRAGMAEYPTFGRFDRITASKIISHSITTLRGGELSESDDEINRMVANSVDEVNEEDDKSFERDVEISTSLSKNATTVLTAGTQQGNDTTQEPIDNSNTNDAGTTSQSNENVSSIAGNEHVGVMQHGKKSNAAGDPDGSDDDDDDDDDEEEEFVFGDGDDAESSSTATIHESSDDDNESINPFLLDDNDKDASVERLNVEVEYTIEEEEENDDDNEIDDNNSGDVSGSKNDAIIQYSTEASQDKRSKNIGGISVRNFGQRFKRGSRRTNKDNGNKKSHSDDRYNSKLEQLFLEAWRPHIYFPPSSQTSSQDSGFWQYLQEHQQSMDNDGRLRLDRRTLYAGLLTEFTTMSSTGKGSNRRRFLDTETSHALQAAISLATQPIWRKSLERPSAIRLYDINDSSDTKYRGSRSTTLAMQETISLGLVIEKTLACFLSFDSIIV